MNETDLANQVTQAPTDHALGPLLDAAVTAGAETSDQKSWNLARPVTLIGRSKGAHIRLDEPTVEPLHAALLNTGDAIVLVDLASREGVFLDGQRIQQRPLRSGESFRVGMHLLRAEINASKGEPEAESDWADRAVQLPWPMTFQVVRGSPGQWTVRHVGATIGTRPGCAITLAGKEVRPVHVLISRVGATPVLVNLAGGRSVRLNGTPVSTCQLSSGDVVEVHPYSFKVMDSPCAEAAGSATQEQPPSESFEERPSMAATQELMDSADAERAATGSERSGSAESTDEANLVQQSQSLAEPDAAEPAADAIIPEAPVPDVHQFESRLQQVQEQLLDSSKQLKQWQQQLERYANKLILKDAELSKRARQLDELQQHLQKTQEELQQRTQQLEQSKSELDEQRRDLEAERSALASEREQISQQRAALETQAQQVRSEEEALQQKYGEFEKIREELQTQQQQLDRQREDLQQQIEQLQAEQLAFRQQREQIEQVEAGLQQRLQDLLDREQQQRELQERLNEQAALIDKFGRVVVEAWQGFAAVVSDSPAAGAPAEEDLSDDDAAADPEDHHSTSKRCMLPLRRLLERPPATVVEPDDAEVPAADPEHADEGDVELDQDTEPADLGTENEATELEATEPNEQADTALVGEGQPDGDDAAAAEQADSGRDEPEEHAPETEVRADASDPAMPTSLDEVDDDVREQVRMLRRLGNNKSDAELIAIVLARKREARPKGKRSWLRR